jgi:hypothetical protein
LIQYLILSNRNTFNMQDSTCENLTVNKQHRADKATELLQLCLSTHTHYQQPANQTSMALAVMTNWSPEAQLQDALGLM